jgi:hypothetical protein
MANSVQKNPVGPFWPLGSIVVATPSTPVNFMSLVDGNLQGDPGVVAKYLGGVPEYTVRAQQIIIQGFKSNAGAGVANNTGNVYVIQKGGTGSNNRTDFGSIILVVGAGLTAVLASAPMNRNVFDPYLLYLDADNANDAAQITLVIQ